MDLKLAKKKVLPKFTQSDKDKDTNEFLDKREEELKKGRKNVFGIDIDNLMEKADSDCLIRETITSSGGKKMLVENEELGQRGVSSFVDLGVDNWQSNIASNEPYVKLMIALSIIFDNDPKAELSAGGKRYASITEVTKQLFENSWAVTHAREVLKAFIFDLGKYGWAVGRTRLSNNVRTISEMTAYNPQTHETREQDKDIEDFTEVLRERLDPHRTWIDEKAVANNRRSINDWMWEKDYSYDALEDEFGDSANFKYIQVGGFKIEPENKNLESVKQLQEDVYTVQFYENYLRDKYVSRVKTENGWVLLDNSSLPYDHKELSLWTSFWNMRHPGTIYGVGPVEIMRGNKKLKNKVKNMTLDQLVLSIYKMGFMENNKAFKGQTKIQVKPGHIEEGVSKITFMEVPGPGQDSKYGIDYLQSEIDADTGIVPQLGGEIVGKTAFETGQAKESALKRLKLPLDNISYALEIEASLSIPLMWQAYTTPLVEHIADQRDIETYLKEVNSDPQFYFLDEQNKFYSKRYKEFELSVENKDGMYIPTGDKKFFYTMPEFIRWKGSVKIKGTSMLSTWKELEKQQKKEMTQTIIELLQLGPRIGLKPIKQLLTVYGENPNDWLPDDWLEPQKSPERQMAQKAKEMFGDNVPPGISQNLPPNQAVNQIEGGMLQKITANAV
jgi:hypothetical protein